MHTIDQFTYSLPPGRIAHTPAFPRDSSKLLVLNRDTGEIRHQHFFDLPDLLSANDVIVRNNTKVMPARIFGRKSTGGHCEILLIKQVKMTEKTFIWECLTKPGLKPGQEVEFGETASSTLRGKCIEISGYTRIIEFNQFGSKFYKSLNQIGHTPVPPYIKWQSQDEQHLREIYQTTYAKITGSVAAPTAGLHFTPELDAKLRAKGVQIEEVTLHVGLGTFLPVQAEQLQTGTLHHEVFELTAETAARLNQAKRDEKRIIAVGTTTTRVLETCAKKAAESENKALGHLTPQSGETDLFIQPGFQFRFVDSLITNFHLPAPDSSLLFLVAAFVSSPNTAALFQTFAKSTLGKAYQEAINHEYRFYSFGDAMWIY